MHSVSLRSFRRDHSGSGPSAPGLRWHIDEITDAGVVGWVFAPDHVNRRCIVALKEHGRLHARATASRHRPHLQEAGIGDGICEFLLPLPYGLLDGEEHELEIIEESTGRALTDAPLRWRSTAGSAGSALTGRPAGARQSALALPPASELPAGPVPRATIELRSGDLQAGGDLEAGALPVQTRLLFDVSDFVHYLADAAHLTGIQRVQASVMQALLAGALPPGCSAIFISFNDLAGGWEAIPKQTLTDILHDLSRPTQQRTARFSAAAARVGHLDGALPFDATGVLDDGAPSVLCLLGAGWNKPDHVRRILCFKRRFGTRFVMLVHDLLPMVARETCDPDTAAAFEAFLHRAARHADQLLTVSENTRKDLRVFINQVGLPEPDIRVIRNGSTFAEFLPLTRGDDHLVLPPRFVLCVATIESRKNHALLFEVWRRMLAAGEDPPHLVCVGRPAHRAAAFSTGLAESDRLDGRIVVHDDIDDQQLRRLYESCLFTVYPSLYEGWGLPVGESLAAGKICVCSTGGAIPEVAGDLTPCLDPSDIDAWQMTVRRLLTDEAARRAGESIIRRHYHPTSWASVAATLAGACIATASTQRGLVDPHPLLPYAREISFAAGPGCAEIRRRGWFLANDLTERDLILAEEARGDGIWAAPEPWGTWLCQDAGDLRFALDRFACRACYLFLRLRASRPIAGAPAVICANGQIVWQGRFAEKPQTITLRISRQTLADAEWRLVLGFKIDVLEDHRRAIAALDRRLPHLGFQNLVVVAEDDLKTRLDILAGLHRILDAANMCHDNRSNETIERAWPTSPASRTPSRPRSSWPQISARSVPPGGTN